MFDDYGEEITVAGIIMLLVKCIGWGIILGIPIYLFYRLLKWFFEQVDTTEWFKRVGCFPARLGFLERRVMSIENIDTAKPEAKNAELNFLEKYKTDLTYLKNGKMTIERRMVEKGIDDEVIDKKLRKLTKSIERLEQLISNYEKEIENDIDDSSDSSEDEE